VPYSHDFITFFSTSIDSVDKNITEEWERKEYRKVCDRLMDVKDVGTVEAIKAFLNLNARVKSSIKEKSNNIRI
jgi:hypothetical protein